MRTLLETGFDASRIRFEAPQLDGQVEAKLDAQKKAPPEGGAEGGEGLDRLTVRRGARSPRP
jgi:hypothetical protein